MTHFLLHARPLLGTEMSAFSLCVISWNNARISAVSRLRANAGFFGE